MRGPVPAIGKFVRGFFARFYANVYVTRRARQNLTGESEEVVINMGAVGRMSQKYEIGLKRAFFLAAVTAVTEKYSQGG